MIILSATGSNIFPHSDTWLSLRATKPSNQSVNKPIVIKVSVQNKSLSQIAKSNGIVIIILEILIIFEIVKINLHQIFMQN